VDHLCGSGRPQAQCLASTGCISADSAEEDRGREAGSQASFSIVRRPKKLMRARRSCSGGADDAEALQLIHRGGRTEVPNVIDTHDANRPLAR
jgi:hypothetical protein